MFAAIAARDADGAIAMLHPDVVWSPTVWSGPSTLRGRDAVRGWFAQFGPDLEYLRIDVTYLRLPAGWVIVCGVEHDSRAAAFATRVGWNFAVEGGLVIEGRAFPSWEEAMSAGRAGSG